MTSMQNSFSRMFMRWETVLIVLLIAEILIFGAINPRFLKASSLLYSTSDFVQIGIVALPLTLVIIAGGIDVSFASVVGLSAIVFGVANSLGIDVPVAILLALLAGGLCGLFNATIIYASNIQPLVVTLGSLYLFSGIAVVLSGAVGAGGYEGIGNFPISFTEIANMDVFGIPMPLTILLLEALILGVILQFTRFGRMVYLVGLSENAARYNGLPIQRVRMLTYVGLGVFAAIAGIVLTSYFGSARTDLGTQTLLPAVTVVALGGASVYGGKGTVLGTLIATLLVGYLQQGLQMSGVSSQISGALSGALLLIAVSGRQLATGVSLLSLVWVPASTAKKK